MDSTRHSYENKGQVTLTWGQRLASPARVLQLKSVAGVYVVLLQ
jgi:hypothetical protein